MELVAVMASVSNMDAQIKAAMLESYGIPARVLQSALNDRFSPSLFGNYLMCVDVLVPEDRAEEALALLTSEGEMEETGAIE
jgi:hypothetical protein